MIAPIYIPSTSAQDLAFSTFSLTLMIPCLFDSGSRDRAQSRDNIAQGTFAHNSDSKLRGQSPGSSSPGDSRSKPFLSHQTGLGAAY